jgi:hypothetical protein
MSATVTVGIPFMDRADLTGPLVDSLLAQGGFDSLLLFDNGSTEPDTAAWVDTLTDPRIEIVTGPEIPEQSLYASWNATIARGTYALILNNDVTICDGFVAGLTAALDDTPTRIAAVYPEVRDCGGRTAGATVPTRGMWPDGLTPFAFMLDCTIGMPPIDEQFRFYSGDVELLWRLQAGGYTAARAVGVRCQHRLGATRKRHSLGDVIAADRQLRADKYPLGPRSPQLRWT